MCFQTNSDVLHNSNRSQEKINRCEGKPCLLCNNQVNVDEIHSDWSVLSYKN